MRNLDQDAEWLVRTHHWLVLAFVLCGAGACLAA